MKWLIGGLLAFFGAIGLILSTLCLSPYVFATSAIAHAILVGIAGAGILTIIWTLIYTVALILIGGVLGLALSAIVAALGAAIVSD